MKPLIPETLVLVTYGNDTQECSDDPIEQTHRNARLLSLKQATAPLYAALGVPTVLVTEMTQTTRTETLYYNGKELKYTESNS